MGAGQKITNPREAMLKVTAVCLEICSLKNSPGDPEAVWAHPLSPSCQEAYDKPILIPASGGGKDARCTHGNDKPGCRGASIPKPKKGLLEPWQRDGFEGGFLGGGSIGAVLAR